MSDDFRAHLEPIPCKFCGRPTPYSPLEEMEEHGVKVYFCQPCRAEYLFFDNGHPASVSLYIEINQKMYRWTVSAAGTARLWYIADPGVPMSRRNDDLKLLKSFGTEDNIPYVTPQNIINKIKTWLVFL